jgi:apolipoprotein N-acyltransferase
VIITIAVAAVPDPDTSGNEEITISLLQGDFGLPWEERVARLDDLIVPAYLEMYRDRASASDLVVAPEYAVPLALEDRPDIIAVIRAAVDSLGAPFLLGAEGRVPGETELYFNMAWMFRPHQEPVGAPARYPAPYTLHETRAGSGPITFDDPVPMGVMLCFDVAVPRLSRDLGRSQGLLVMLSNLQGFDGTPTKRFMRGLIQLRAAETGRWLAIAANTGPTGIIDPRGRAIGWAGPGRRTVSGTIRLTKRPSWYVLYGTTLIWVVWTASLAFSAWNARFRKSARQPEGVSNDEHAGI